MRGKFSRQKIILYCLGAVPVVWIALLIAPALSYGLPGLLRGIGSVFEHPFSIHWGENSLNTVLALFCVYGLFLMVYLSTERNYRRREEHGSAKWGDPFRLLKKYADKDRLRNKILTQNVSIGLDGRRHRRNLNVLVCGGSGAGKTRFYAKPNIMNANSSLVILDPKL